MSTDRETIREWADDHHAVPVQHEEERERYGIVRKSELADSHEQVEWSEFDDQLDQNDKVVIYHGAEATEPFEVVPRERAVMRSESDEEDLERRLIEGETVTTEVTDRRERTAEGEPIEGAGRVTLSEDEIGKTVVDARGEEIGMVSEVEPDNGIMYVDPHPGIAEKIKAVLDWGDADEEDYIVKAGQVRDIAGDQMELKETEKLESDERRR